MITKIVPIFRCVDFSVLYKITVVVVTLLIKLDLGGKVLYFQGVGLKKIHIIKAHYATKLDCTPRYAL